MGVNNLFLFFQFIILIYFFEVYYNLYDESIEVNYHSVNLFGGCLMNLSGGCLVNLSGRCLVNLSGGCLVNLSGGCLVNLSGGCLVNLSDWVW